MTKFAICWSVCYKSGLHNNVLCQDFEFGLEMWRHYWYYINSWIKLEPWHKKVYCVIWSDNCCERLKMAPKDFQARMPGSYYIWQKGLCRHEIKDFEMGKLSWISQINTKCRHSIFRKRQRKTWVQKAVKALSPREMWHCRLWRQRQARSLRVQESGFSPRIPGRGVP